MGGFSEALGDITHGKLEIADKVADTPEVAPADAPSKESPSATDTPTQDPKPAAAEPEKPSAEEPAKPETPAAPEVAAPVPPAAPDPNEVIEVGDFKGTRAELEKELERRGLRQADYTRKRQEDAAARDAAEANVREMRELTRDITRDEALQKFLAAHPDALDVLLEDPKATRKLVGNPRAVEDFWTDYEILKENPRIAQRMVSSAEPSAEVTEELREQRQAQAVMGVATALSNAVAEVAKEFEGVSADEVQSYLLELGGADPKNPPKDQASAQRLFGRLYNMMFIEQGDEVFVDTRLIRDRFAQLKGRQAPAPATKAEEHNKQIDEALKREGAPPASPKGGAPAPAAEPAPKFKDFRDALDSIYAG